MYPVKLSSAVLIFLVAVSGCTAEETRQSIQVERVPDTVSTDDLVEGGNRFALELYLEACEGDQAENIFFSPFSISSALAMTYTAARGETAGEMEEVLHFGLSPGMVGRGFRTLMDEMSSGDLSGAESGEPFTLTIANGLWVKEGFQLLEEYRQSVAEYFDAAVENLDFSGDPEGSRQTINRWVAERTLDRIQDLIPPGILGEDTRVVLTNAVYFKASWDKPFDENATSDGRFLLADGSAVVVPMMNQTEFFRYCSLEGCRAVELFYAGGDASMLIVLPDGDIQEFQDDLDVAGLERIRESMSSVNLSLTMPRFEFTATMQLSGMLQSMGMETAFSGDADLSGFTGTKDLYISEVIHKAFVKVDEAGTEAAAATAVMVNIISMPPPPEEMNINRPFMFFIMDGETGTIVFMGRVMDPAG